MGNGSVPHVSHLLPGNSELARTCSYGDGRGAREKVELSFPGWQYSMCVVTHHGGWRYHCP